MRSNRMGEVARGYVAGEKFAGIEWCVKQHGEVLSEGREGVADLASGTPIPDGAVYRIYSMTKPVVSVLALILMEQGRLRLYDPLPVHDPAFANMTVVSPDGAVAPAARPITVEDLITHRSGMTYDFIVGCHVAQYYRDAEILSAAPLEEMMARLAKLPLASQPGTQFRYSVSTDVLAWVCERATGRTISELLHEFIFEPLDMRHTGYRVTAADRPQLMSMYGVGDLDSLGSLTPPPHELNPVDVDDTYPVDDPVFRRGGHGLYSTLADYQKFAEMLLTGQTPDGATVLSRKTVELMRANRIPDHQLPLRIGPNVLAGYGWGLGVRVMRDLGQAQSLTGLGELGWAGAASTYFWVDPAEAMTGVIMTQFLGSMLPLSDDLRVAAYQALG